MGTIKEADMAKVQSIKFKNNGDPSSNNQEMTALRKISHGPVDAGKTARPKVSMKKGSLDKK